MYIHLGKESVVRQEDVIGIFDLDTATISKHTRKYLSIAEKKGEVVTVTEELPKSFVVVNEKGKRKIYLSQISSLTLEKRAEYLENL